MSFLTSKGKAPIKMEKPERFSEKAIAFGQHIVELETAITSAQETITDLMRDLRDAQAECKRLNERLRTAEKDKEYYSKRWYETKAKLKASASIILDAMREDDDPAGTYRPSPAAVRAVEKALGKMTEGNDGTDEPLPDFLAAGPAIHEDQVK